MFAQRARSVSVRRRLVRSEYLSQQEEHAGTDGFRASGVPFEVASVYLKENKPMKNLVHAARSAFGVRTSLRPPKTSGVKQRETDTEIVSHLSSGNVLLQHGRFSTKEDIDRDRERALAKKL